MMFYMRKRNLVAEIIEFQVLGDDYSKLAFLCANHFVFLHAKYEIHHNILIPRMGRDIVYVRWSCDLIFASSSPYLYRINLEQGYRCTFSEAFCCSTSSLCNCDNVPYHFQLSIYMPPVVPTHFHRHLKSKIIMIDAHISIC